MADRLQTLDVPDRRAWRRWLAAHHRDEREVWLVYHKRHTDRATLDYNASVEEALCFGWVDSLIRRLDDDRYARKFTPRTANSPWSTANRRRYADLDRRGLLTRAGRERSPTSRSGDAPRPTAAAANEVRRALRRHPRAWTAFAALAPSHQRRYLAWMTAAKRQETRERRLRAAVSRLVSGTPIGLG